MQLSAYPFCCLHENIYHIFQFLCRRLFINKLKAGRYAFYLPAFDDIYQPFAISTSLYSIKKS